MYTPKVNYYFLDNNNIIHKDGIIINLNTLKLIYNNNHNNYIYFNKIKTFFPSLMLKYFYFNGNKMPTRRDVIHFDNNIYNNEITNIIYKPHKENNYNSNLLNCIKKKNNIENTYKNRLYYLLIINKYNINYDLLQSYNQISQLNIKNIREFMLRLLNNKYIYHDNHFWNLEIRKIYLTNLNDYIKLIDNVYYIHKDLSHVINVSTNNLLKIYLDINQKHYVNLYGQKNNIIRLHLDYYDNPYLHKISINKVKAIEQTDNILVNTIVNNFEFDDIFNEFNEFDDIFNEFECSCLTTYSNEFNNYYNKNDLDIEFDYLDNLQNFLTLL